MVMAYVVELERVEIFKYLKASDASAGRRLHGPLYVPPTFPDRYTSKDTLDCLGCFGITVIETTY